MAAVTICSDFGAQENNICQLYLNKKKIFNCGGGVTQSLFPGCLETIKKTMSIKPHHPLSSLVNGIYISFNHFGSSQTTNCDSVGLLSLPDSSLLLCNFSI